MAGKKMSNVYVSWPKPSFIVTVKTNKNFRTNFHAAMMYAHYELTSAELKKETLIYLKKTDKHPLLERAKNIDENRFTTIGKYMYIMNHGADVPDDIMPKLLPALEKIIDDEEANKVKIENANAIVIVNTTDASIKTVISIQDRLREKAREVAGEIEGWIDDFCIDKKIPVKTIEDFVSLFKQYELKSPHIHHIKDIFSNRKKEILEVIEGKDKDLVEAYSNYSKPELKKYYLFNENLFKACDMMQAVAKVERVPRKQKPISQEKVVSKLKFKKDDNTLGIVSLSPVSIIGARELWCFDTKTRKLTKYVADDISGPISVKGSTLIGYNKTKSSSKTLRKPVAQLAEFKKCGKVQLRSFMDDIGTISITPNGRMNENCIILKIA